MLHILAELAPLKISDGSRPVLRAASAQDRRLSGVGGARWWPAMSKRPSIAIPLFDGDFTQDVAPGSASFTIRLDALENLDPLVRAHRWPGATVTLYAIDSDTGLNAAGSYDVSSLDAARIFKGRVESYSGEGNGLSISASVDLEPFQIDVLGDEYAGTGDDEGGADLKGRLKPWIFGRALNVEPLLINNVDNVVQFSAYPIEGISALYERGASFGASIGNYATYDLLVAATIPAGRWATCHARGMARLGAPPYGVITGDIDGDNGAGFIRTTGAIIQRVAAVRGVDTALLDAASLAALDVAVPYPVNIVLTEQTSLLDLARRLARPCNAQAGVDFLGRLFAVRPTIGSPSLTLDAQGRRMPPVRKCAEADVSPPYMRIMFGANRSWRVHSFDEIAFDAELVDRGDYDPAKTYRNGNIVSLPNGSRWLFVGDTPKTGSLPEAGNADWELMTGPITAGNITYEDGTPVEDLKPAEPGATVGATPEQVDQLDQLAIDTAAAEAAIAAVQVTITTMQSDAAAVQAALTTAQGDIAAQGAAIVAAQADILANSDDIQTATTTLTSHGAAITTLQTTASTHTGQIASLTTTVSTQGASITTAQSAITTLQGSVATLTTRVNAGAPNLLPNGGFENGLSGWTGANFSYATDSSWGPRAVATATGTYTLESAAQPAVASASYTIAADTRMNAGGGTIYVDMIYRDGSGNILLDGAQSARAPVHEFSSTTAGREAIATTTTAPAGSATWVARFVVAGATSVTSIGVRLIKVERSATWSPYSDEASIVQSFTAISTNAGSLASLTTTVSTQGASITTLQSASATQAGQIATHTTQISTANANIATNASAITTANTNIASLTTTVSTQGAAITTAQSAITTLQGSVATLTTRVNAGGVNLLPNGGLEDGFNSGIVSAGTFTLVSSTAWGRYAQTTTTGTQTFQFAPVAVSSSTTYTLSCDPLLFGGASTGYVDVLGYNSGGTQVYDGPQSTLTGPSDFDTTTGRRGQIATTFTTPSDVVSVRCRFVATVASGNICGFRQMKLERGSTWSPYTGEASAAQSFSALSTLSSQYASLDTTVATHGVTITSQQTAITTINGNVTTLFGRAALTIEAGGVITGWEVNNNGSTGDIKLRADRVSVVTASGGTKTFEIRQGTIIGYHADGSKMYQLGDQAVV